MRRRTRLAIACALAAAFILVGPYVTRAGATPYQARVIHSLQVRNARQARVILRLQRQVHALESSSGLILVTLPELVGYSRNGIRIGLIYVDSLED